MQYGKFLFKNKAFILFYFTIVSYMNKPISSMVMAHQRDFNSFVYKSGKEKKNNKKYSMSFAHFIILIGDQI